MEGGFIKHARIHPSEIGYFLSISNIQFRCSSIRATIDILGSLQDNSSPGIIES